MPDSLPTKLICWVLVCVSVLAVHAVDMLVDRIEFIKVKISDQSGTSSARPGGTPVAHASNPPVCRGLVPPPPPELIP